MSLCDIFPDDESCQQPVVDQPTTDPATDTTTDPTTEGGEAGAGGDEVTDGGDEGAAQKEEAPAAKADFGEAAAAAVADWTRVKEMSGFADLSPMMGNLQLAGAAGGWAFWSAMDAFRYRSDSKYYDGGELTSGDTNYWKMSDMLRLYSGLAIGGVLMVTSLMAAFGISPALNAMLWMWMGLVGMIIGLVVGVLRFLGYDAAYSHYDGKAYGSAEHLKGAAVMG